MTDHSYTIVSTCLFMTRFHDAMRRVASRKSQLFTYTYTGFG